VLKNLYTPNCKTVSHQRNHDVDFQILGGHKLKSDHSRTTALPTRVRTAIHLNVSHEYFLLAMFLHRSLICYVCYVLITDFRYYVKNVKFRVKLVAGYTTILVMNNENHAIMSNFFQLPLTEKGFELHLT